MGVAKSKKKFKQTYFEEPITTKKDLIDSERIREIELIGGHIIISGSDTIITETYLS